jgi:hypothetical protein
MPWKTIPWPDRIIRARRRVRVAELTRSLSLSECQHKKYEPPGPGPVGLGTMTRTCRGRRRQAADSWDTVAQQTERAPGPGPPSGTVEPCHHVVPDSDIGFLPDIGSVDIGSPTDTISGHVSRYRGFLLTRYRDMSNASAKWAVHIYYQYAKSEHCTILHIVFGVCILFCILKDIYAELYVQYAK